MGKIGLVHTGFAVASLLLGGTVIALQKGTRLHRLLGQLYASGMVGVIVTSFMIYRLVGGWGPFHYAATISAVTLVAGLVPAMLRRPRRSWVIVHLQFMSYSYIGLVAALFSESAVRLPIVAPLMRALGFSSAGHAFALAVAIPTLATFVIGAMIVHRHGMRTGKALQAELTSRAAREPAVQPVDM
jgi:uncharacterized membrane protein